ncbi:MAG: DUF1499 domain-containing protein, partial [Beijerinckiaceae bacterium]
MRRVPAEPMTRLAPLSRWLGLASLAMALVAVGGVRFGGVPPLNGIGLLAVAIAAAGIGLVAAGGALNVIWRHGGPGAHLAVKGLLLACCVLAPAAWFGALAVRLPVLNDVTTDVADPPSFGRSRAAVDGRGGLIVREFDTATAQDHQEAYPELQP